MLTFKLGKKVFALGDKEGAGVNTSASADKGDAGCCKAKFPVLALAIKADVSRGI